jgi:hypothetical protein
LPAGQLWRNRGGSYITIYSHSPLLFLSQRNEHKLALPHLVSAPDFVTH